MSSCSYESLGDMVIATGSASEPKPGALYFLREDFLDLESTSDFSF